MASWGYVCENRKFWFRPAKSWMSGDQPESSDFGKTARNDRIGPKDAESNYLGDIILTFLFSP